MNAPFTPPTKAEQEARELAADILAGKYAAIHGPYGKCGVYTAKEWTAAAQYATDSDDLSEMVYMMEHEAACEDGVSDDRWADEADYRYDLMRDEQMLAAWERAA